MFIASAPGRLPLVRKHWYKQDILCLNYKMTFRAMLYSRQCERNLVLKELISHKFLDGGLPQLIIEQQIIIFKAQAPRYPQWLRFVKIALIAKSRIIRT